MIKNIKIFANNNIKSNKIKCELINKLKESGFKIDENNFDLGIAIGGDGSFLRMVKNTKFDTSKYYIGINTGTLGFAQEVNADELDDFIDKLKNDKYKVEEIGVEEIKVTHDNIVDKHFALNDLTIRDNELNTTKLEVKIGKKLLENFVGDGLLISTSFGSTAYNLSFGGCIIDNSLHTLQITPIAPLNSKAYRTLMNSIVIPQDKKITITPLEDKSNLIISIDGENFFLENVSKLEATIKDKRIKCLREENYNFIIKVNEKFLK